jgi:uroporphyrinogen III methyltransferase/synthase
VTAATALAGKRVLVTRALGQADAFAERLRAAGAEPIVAPTIAIGPPDDPAAAERAIAAAAGYAWIVFTSSNAVDAFVAPRATPPALGAARVAAIGPATAAALGRAGLRVDFTPGEHVNEAVAAGLLERTEVGDRVLLFRAQEARDVLPASLRDAGRTVDVVAAYATRSVVDPSIAAAVARADVVTLASTSALTGLLANLADPAGALAGKTVAAIGPITARAARERGVRVDVVAADFSIDGLLRALADGTAP